MTDETQPVAPVADTAPAAQPEATSAQTATPDLSTFLDEYEAQAKTAPPPPAPPAAAAPSEIAELKREVEAIRRERAIAREQADRADVFKRVKGDLPIDDYTVRGFLDAKAETNPLINEIWANRDRNPRAAEKLIAGLHKELRAEQSKPRPDRNATEDREAVAAAMRGGSSTTAPAEKEPAYGSMSDAEFAAAKAKMGL